MSSSSCFDAKISNRSKLPLLEVWLPAQSNQTSNRWLIITFFFYPQEAISSHPTDSKKGVSRVSIKKYVYTCRIKLSMLTIRARYLEDKYKLDMSAASNTSNLNGAIKRAVEKNELALPGGPSGRVKLVAVSSSSYPAFLSVLKTVLPRRPPSPRPLRRRLPPRPLPRRLFLPLRRLPLLSLLLPRPRLLFLRRRLRLRALLPRRLLKRRLLLRRRPKLLLVSLSSAFKKMSS